MSRGRNSAIAGSVASTLKDLIARLAINVRQRRTALGLSQAKLAARAGYRRERTVKDIEAGRLRPSMTTIARLAAALGCDLADLLAPVPEEKAAQR